MRVVCIGAGQVGRYIGQLLKEHHHDVLLVESRENSIEMAHKMNLPVLSGDATDPSILDQADLKNADVVLAVTGSDVTNLIVSTLAKYEYGVTKVIGRVNNPLNDWLYTISMGVDQKLNQAERLGKILVKESEERVQ